MNIIFVQDIGTWEEQNSVKYCNLYVQCIHYSADNGRIYVFALLAKILRILIIHPASYVPSLLNCDHRRTWTWSKALTKWIAIGIARILSLILIRTTLSLGLRYEQVDSEFNIA